MTLRRRTEPNSAPLADVGADVDRELQAHLDARTDALISEGLDPLAASAQALREFGDIEDARRYMRAVGVQTEQTRRRRDYMGELRQDVRYAVRRLWAAPAFTAASVLTLALGIGATTAIFSLVYGVLFRPLPFPHPERLYSVYSANVSSGSLRASVSAVDVDDWRAGRRDIEDLGGVMFQAGSSGVDLTGHGDPRRLPAAFITPGFFSALGVSPALGRLPREEEMTRGGPDDVVVLSHGFWQREFAGAADVAGRVLTIGGTPHEVLGVLPASMRFPSDRVDVYIPFSTLPDTAIPRVRVVRVLDVIARAKAGVTQPQVEAEMAAITARLARDHAENRNWGQATVVPLAEVMTGPVRDGLLVLLAAVGLVLLMAAVNVAALQVARAAGRGRELAVRVALGARRGRLVRQLLTESLVLAGVGCAAGVALSYGLLRVLMALAAGQLPRAAEVAVDGAAIAFAVVVSAGAGVLFGMAPALRAMRTAPQDALGGGTRGTVGSDSQRLRSGLVIAEVAVAVVLVVCGGLMARSFIALLDTDPGFDRRGLVAVQFTIDADRHAAPPDPSRPTERGYMTFYRDVLERVRALPGVESAAAVKNAPFRGEGERNAFTIPDRPVPAGQDNPTASVIHVSDGYFSTIGARMAGGREFSPRDDAGAPFVVVVNEAFARHFFPGEPAVGKHLRFGVPVEIIGVVHDVRQVSMAVPPAPTIYLHNLQNGRVQMTIVARSSGNALALAPSIRQAIWALDPQQPIADVYTFNDSMGLALARPRLLVVLLGSFGVLGLVLGAVGIYGVLAGLVNLRQREIGMRIVLGARPGDVLRMVVGHGLALTGIGLVLGLTGAWWLTRFLGSVLYGVGATDPLTFGGVVVVLTTAALAASWLPALRATRVDPAEVIRGN
jgi:predicted permease